MARKGTPHFFIEDKTSPDYKPKYGSTYTNRQIDILCEKIPLEEIRTAELGLLCRKAEQLNDYENYEIARLLYDRKTDPGKYYPKTSIEDAKAILQSMLPWKIDWNE